MNKIIKKASLVLCFVLLCIPQLLYEDLIVLDYNYITGHFSDYIRKFFLVSSNGVFAFAGTLLLWLFYVIVFRSRASDKFKIFFFSSQLIIPVYGFFAGLISIKWIKAFISEEDNLIQTIISSTAMDFLVLLLGAIVPVFFLRKLYLASSDNKKGTFHSLAGAMLLIVILLIIDIVEVMPLLK